MALIKTPESQASEYVNRVITQFTGMGKQIGTMLEKGIAANVNANAPAVTAEQLKAALGDGGLLTVKIVQAALVQADPSKLEAALAILMEE